MKKNLFIGFLSSTLFLLPLVASAAFNDVTLTAGVTSITVGNFTVNAYSDDATIESITVDSSSFDVVLLSGSSITLDNTTRRVFTVSPASGTFTINRSCTLDRSILVLTGTGSSVTVTVGLEPIAECTPTSLGGGGGGGGGSGTTYTPPDSQPSTQTPTTPVAVTPISTQQTAANQLSTPAVYQSPFNRSLSVGSEGNDVVELQTFLENQGFLTIPLGVAKGYFGTLTKNALTAFQVANGIDPVGIFGPITKASLEAKMFVGMLPASNQQIPPTSAGSSSYNPISKALSMGTRDPEVRFLQQSLNADIATRLTDIGLGSPGNETEYFGEITLDAVRRFQEKYGIARPGDPGYGHVGPKTRAKLNELAR